MLGGWGQHKTTDWGGRFKGYHELVVRENGEDEKNLDNKAKSSIETTRPTSSNETTRPKEDKLHRIEKLASSLKMSILASTILSQAAQLQAIQGPLSSEKPGPVDSLKQSDRPAINLCRVFFILLPYFFYNLPFSFLTGTPPSQWQEQSDQGSINLQARM